MRSMTKKRAAYEALAPLPDDVKPKRIEVDVEAVFAFTEDVLYRWNVDESRWDEART